MNQGKPIHSILIVGGGTAGWLSAAYLQRAVGKTVRIQLVESPTIGRIGVGEATVQTLRWTMAFLGFSEADWMPVAGATYKTGIRFEQWNQPPSEGPEHFYHPFYERHEPKVHPIPTYFPEIGDGISLMHYWHKRYLAGDKTPYAYAVTPGPSICDARKSPRFKDAPSHEIPTAYHLDAHRFGDFLMKTCIERGVDHVSDDVTEVMVNEQGYISGVRTKDHGVLSADLYIDCSGFRSIILKQALHEPFLSASKYLWNDAAVATRPANAPGDIEPYTLARASEAGWMWNIPLYHRAGTGYVYCSRYKTPAEAEKEILDYLGPRIAKDAFIAHLKFEPGRYARTWVKNCVAIGLAGNFIEPLESTTIFLIEYALGLLVTFFPDTDFDDARAERFNRLMAEMYDEIRDFIVLHFIGSNRRDTPYWRDLTQTPAIPDSLAAKLAVYRTGLPVGESLSNFVFRERAYACFLAGLRMLPPKPYPLLAHVGSVEADQAFAAMQERTADLVRRLPGQREYLDHLYASAGMKFI